MRGLITGLAAAAAMLFLAACGEPTKGDILDKAKAATTKAELEKALGKPAEVNKLGPIENWTYKAKDGVVNFVITGDRVALQTTGDAPAK